MKRQIETAIAATALALATHLAVEPQQINAKSIPDPYVCTEPEVLNFSSFPQEDAIKTFSRALKKEFRPEFAEWLRVVPDLSVGYRLDLPICYPSDSNLARTHTFALYVNDHTPAVYYQLSQGRNDQTLYEIWKIDFNSFIQINPGLPNFTTPRYSLNQLQEITSHLINYPLTWGKIQVNQLKSRNSTPILIGQNFDNHQISNLTLTNDGHLSIEKFYY